VLLTAYSDNDGPSSTLVITGAIADFGHAMRVRTNGASHTDYDQIDLQLTRGAFRLNIVDLETTLAQRFKDFPTDPTTCSGIVTATAPTPIVSGSGTGAYQGISGSLAMTVTVNEVDASPQCGGLLAQSVFTTATGTVSLP
jgi:hypothetical protein